MFEFVSDETLDAAIEDLFPLAPLGPVEHARLMAKAKAMYEELHPETRAGTAQGNSQKRLHGHLRTEAAPSFRDYVVKKAHGRRGWKDTAVKEAVRRGTRIAPEVLDAVASTDFETIGHMNQLAAKNTVDEQFALLLMWQTPIEVLPPNGEVYQAGRIRLECEDSRSRMQQMLASGKQVDLVLVDPPYGVQRDVRGLGVMEGDHNGSLWAVELMAGLVKEGGYLALWTARRTIAEWAEAITTTGLQIQHVLRWHKPNLPEYIAAEYLIIAGHAPCSRLDLTCDTLPSNHPLREVHQSPKPPDLMEMVIEALCPADGVVADFFAGTCPVGVAAVRLGREYLGVEISPKHFATAREQLQKAIEEQQAVEVVARAA